MGAGHRLDLGSHIPSRSLHCPSASLLSSDPASQILSGLCCTHSPPTLSWAGRHVVCVPPQGRVVCGGSSSHGCSQRDPPGLPGPAAAWLLQDPPGDQARGQVLVLCLQKRPAEALPGPVWPPLLLLLPEQHPQVCGLVSDVRCTVWCLPV